MTLANHVFLEIDGNGYHAFATTSFLAGVTYQQFWRDNH